MEPIYFLKNNYYPTLKATRQKGFSMPKVIEADDIAKLFSPGDTVFLQSGSGEPTALTETLRQHPEASDGVSYVSVLIPGVNKNDPAAFHENAELTTFFIYGDVSDSFAAGRIRFMPLHYSNIPEYLRSQPLMDTALIQVSPPDAEGSCSLGISVDFVPDVLHRTRTIIAEVNERMPNPPGSVKIPFETLDFVVHSDRPLLGIDVGDIPEQLEEIARCVADLINDGDCLQVGIGKLPSAIMSGLSNKRNLGFHSGMITDEVIPLVESGVINGAKKTVDTGKLVCGIALGSDSLYSWCGRRDDLLFRPVTETHDPCKVSRIDNFVSINSVLEVDLLGQVNAETLGGKQVSGTGGLVDFVRSARMSRGGRSILALTATAGKKRIPRIVPKLDSNSVVSGLRTDIDYVVTEFGAVQLKHKSIDERSSALISIAAPEHREELRAAWENIRNAAGGKCC